MKIGFRTPNFKKSLKARTIGKAKRTMKKAVNPFYGKKGTGFAKNPAKSIKSSVYNKTTFGLNDIINTSNNKGSNKKKTNSESKKQSKINASINFTSNFPSYSIEEKTYCWKLCKAVEYDLSRVSAMLEGTIPMNEEFIMNVEKFCEENENEINNAVNIVTNHIKEKDIQSIVDTMCSECNMRLCNQCMYTMQYTYTN